MSEFTKYRKFWQTITPPHGVTHQLNRQVMSSIQNRRKGVTQQLRGSLILAGSIAILVFMVMTTNRAPMVSLENPDQGFVVRKMILNNHVAIWLEPEEDE